MRDISGAIEYKGVTYKIVFNLNVMEAIQEEYGTIEKWGDLTDGSGTGEANIRALKFGIGAMINEGIDIMNEDDGADLKPLTLRQVGRLLSDIGFDKAAELLQQTVEASTKTEIKNA